MEAVRLNKYLSDAGICSRRQADRYVEEGKITVDGVRAVMGQKVLPTQEICVCGNVIGRDKAKKVVLAFYKPKGIVCTSQKREPDNIIDYIGYPERIYPIGRLDKDSEGLILLTNDGALMNEILSARNYHEKEYEVYVNKEINDRFLKKMSSGVEILDRKTRPCIVEMTGPQSFRIILTQGLNRQIRRMCETMRYEVRKLKRVRIMNITLDGLKEGQYREITGKEKRQLLGLIKKGPSQAQQRETEAAVSAIKKKKEAEARREDAARKETNKRNQSEKHRSNSKVGTGREGLLLRGIGDMPKDYRKGKNRHVKQTRSNQRTRRDFE